MNIRTRTEKSANYHAVFFKGQTLRIPINPALPITELEYPEFYDLSFGDKCVTGKCPWCYAKGNPKGQHYPNIVQKIKDYFGSMTPNQRPFQVAIGGQQEPLEHPEIEGALAALSELGIVPNFTTNGVLFDDNAVRLAKTYCGGVAITMHPHLEEHWRKAIALATSSGIRTNVHFVVSDEESVKLLMRVFDEYKDKVEYFVLLPHMNVGFAARNPKTVAYDMLEKWLDTVSSLGNVAFGANFYKFLTRLKKWDVSLYPPEILSKYLVMNDKMLLCNNSFDMKPVAK